MARPRPVFRVRLPLLPFRGRLRCACYAFPQGDVGAAKYKPVYKNSFTPPGMRTLFIGHDASRTGAPLLLLWWLRWLRARTALDGHLWLARSGPLEPEYREVLPVTDLSKTLIEPVAKVARRVFGAAFEARLREAAVRRHVRRSGFEAVWCNTAVNGQWVRFLSKTGLPIACNLHELPNTIHQSIWGDRFRHDHAQVDRWVACSQGVAQCAVQDFGIDPNRIEVVPEFHNSTEREVNAAKADRDRVRGELGLGASDFLVGMVGTMDRRKGADVFVRLVRDALKDNRYARIHFIWVGGGELVDQNSYSLYDLAKIAPGARCRLIAPREDTRPYLAAMDVFCLTSRIDPYPVAMLEAAAMGLPIVGFRRSGGVEDFVSKGSGIVVPYLDEAAMLEVLLGLSKAPGQCREYGQRACRAAFDHHTIDTVGPALLRNLQAAIESRSASKQPRPSAAP
jgi:glycosyltransferase involved in cell wall biosynthesis